MIKQAEFQLGAAAKALLETLTPEGVKSNVESEELAKIKSVLRREALEKPVVFIGAATCGISAGAAASRSAVKSYFEEKGIDADIVDVGCIGLCSEEPLIDIQLPGRSRVCFRRATSEKIRGILDSVFAGAPEAANVLGQFLDKSFKPWDATPDINEHPFFKPQRRIVLQNCGLMNPCSLDEYLSRGGYKAFAKALHTMTPVEICDEVEGSGLRGRGGGGFPTGKKWRFSLNTSSDQKYMICNADEGDPGAFMDRAVIEGDPHRVLEGLAIASYAIGASKAYVYIRAEYPLAIDRLITAIDQAESYGLLGENILDSGFDLKIIIKKGAGAFVCGEETALIHSIEGKRGMPRPRPPFPAVSGLFGKPSVINNVETLANVPDIISKGKNWYNAVGTAGSKGTKVFALSGKILRTGLVEIPMGTSLREIVYTIGGGMAHGKKFKAVQIGGPSGGCIPESHLDIEVDYETLKTVGAMMGSGGLVSMDEDNCMVDVAKFFMDFIQRESCGKCIPCREGTRHMLEILEDITHGRGSETGYDSLKRFKGVMNLQRLAEVIRDTSLCGLGQTAPNPVLSTLRWFKHEYEAHIYERKCPSGVCRELVKYEILQERCVGCTACARKCPTNAIMGAKKSPHYIIPEKCIGCGSCKSSCKFDAVVVKN